MKRLILPLLTSILFANDNNINQAIINLENTHYDKAIQQLKEMPENQQRDFLLGKAYYERHLTYTDYKFALQYFQKAKTPRAYYYLAQMYEKGMGVEKDIFQAIEYYKLSNTKEAKYELAQFYLTGEYTLKNPDISLSLLKESAKAGYNKAQFLLGKLYLTDNDVTNKNLSEAAKWLFLAAQNGNSEARKLWNKYKLYRYK